ncbi:hypothetical protein GGR57DRAFT_229682 [Xylariaceae sp. FL1272]|nr:hypothetical protein GGR57DRAFT_229682 [Xylariaceae sp. FL1272]
MAPPPATPAPHRFLVPKRSQPRTETPKPKANTFQPGGSGQQFQATPRFSLHSTPRAPSSSTPGPSAFRSRAVEHVEIFDSSPPDDWHDHDIGRFNEGDDERYRGFELPVPRAKDEALGDDVVEESSPIEGHESEEWQEREVKRRRISLSSFASELPQFDDNTILEETDAVMHDEHPRDHALDIESSFPIPEDILPSGEASDSASMDGDTMKIESQSSSPNPDSTPQQQPSALNTNTAQPTFHKAPRFKVPELPEGPAPEPLPDAFSPRRKGAKYIPGGLAAELRDWLVDVEAGTNSASLSNLTSKSIGDNGMWNARLRVLEVSSGPRGTLVVGRVVHDRGGDANDEREGEGESLGAEVRIILAGPGKLSGIQAPSLVRKRCLVGVKKPMWEVSLHGLGRWGVAVNWAVIS